MSDLPCEGDHILYHHQTPLEVKCQAVVRVRCFASMLGKLKWNELTIVMQLEWGYCWFFWLAMSLCQQTSWLFSSFPVASRKMTGSQDADFCVIHWQNFWQSIMYLTTPTFGSWWILWGIMATSHCYLWWRWCLILCDDTHEVSTTLIFVMLGLVLLEVTQWLT